MRIYRERRRTSPWSCLPQRNTHYQAGATPFLGRTLTGWNSLASDGYEINGVVQADQLRAMVARLQSSSR